MLIPLTHRGRRSKYQPLPGLHHIISNSTTVNFTARNSLVVNKYFAIKSYDRRVDERTKLRSNVRLDYLVRLLDLVFLFMRDSFTLEKGDEVLLDLF